MGTFFSNIQIKKTPALDSGSVKAAVTALLERQGCNATADKDKADITVGFCNPDSPWLSVFSDGIGFCDDKTSEAVCKPLSVALSTDVLAVSCLDSDYLFLNLINESQKINAWANVGHPPEGRVSRRTVFSPWKSRVTDLEQFKSAVRGQYDFVEQVWERLEPLLALPAGQGQISEDSLDEIADQAAVSFLYFAVPDEKGKTEPPKLKIPRYSLIPCTIGEDSIVSAVNTAGASKGLAVAFTGDYVENEEIIFTDVKLEYDFDRTPRKEIPVELVKKEIVKGQWAYCAEFPRFPIRERVSPDLPPKRKAELEFAREIGVRFTPLGSPEKVLDICVHLIPLENPEGQCCWCVWHLDGSKDAYQKSRDFCKAPGKRP